MEKTDTDRPMGKKLKRILDHVRLLTVEELKPDSNFLTYAPTIASQMCIPRWHMRVYISLDAPDLSK